MKNKRKHLLSFILTLILGFLLIFLIEYLWLVDLPSQIIFCDYTSESTNTCNLMLIEFPEGKLVNVLPVGGLPSFSKDSRLIAAKCINSTKICIIDSSIIETYKHYPLGNTVSPIIQELETPTGCHLIKDNKKNSSIKSISWSNDNSQIVITCFAPEHPAIICILTLRNSYGCIPREKFPADISVINNADWSPKEELLAISFNGKIWTIEPNGDNLRYIADGWAPSWSRDGENISFFSWGNLEEMGNKKMWVEIFPGIAIVNKDGAQFMWLYPPPNGQDDEMLNTMITPICLGEGHSCKISWSPDDLSIVFSSKYGLNSYNWQIFKIDIKTKKVDFVTTNLSRFYSDPDWGVIYTKD